MSSLNSNGPPRGGAEETTVNERVDHHQSPTTIYRSVPRLWPRAPVAQIELVVRHPDVHDECDDGGNDGHDGGTVPASFIFEKGESIAFLKISRRRLYVV